MATQQLSILTQKRLAGDLKLVKKDPLLNIDIYPDESNQLLWYFCVLGDKDSKYKGGYYIGRIRHNPEYPLKAPELQMMTPSGKFHINSPICLSNTAYHPESWSASWTIIAFLVGFLSIWDDEKSSGIGHLNKGKSECESYARASIEYNLTNHREIFQKFTRFVEADEDGAYLATNTYTQILDNYNAEITRKANKKADKADKKAAEKN